MLPDTWNALALFLGHLTPLSSPCLVNFYLHFKSLLSCCLVERLVLTSLRLEQVPLHSTGPQVLCACSFEILTTLYIIKFDPYAVSSMRKNHLYLGDSFVKETDP